jgi:hypothetical protein
MRIVSDHIMLADPVISPSFCTILKSVKLVWNTSWGTPLYPTILIKQIFLQWVYWGLYLMTLIWLCTRESYEVLHVKMKMLTLALDKTNTVMHRTNSFLESWISALLRCCLPFVCARPSLSLQNWGPFGCFKQNRPPLKSKKNIHKIHFSRFMHFWMLLSFLSCAL